MTLIVRPGYGGAAVSDPDAQTYLQAVEVADNQALEQGVQQAVNQFVIGCKADGIWTAIKASCILAGARTLAGALVPLAGTAPTNVGGLFAEGDYNRETGLVGDGSTKYLDSNRNNNADPQNSVSHAVWISSAPAVAYVPIGAGFNLTGSTRCAPNISATSVRVRTAAQMTSNTVGVPNSNTLFGYRRSASNTSLVRINSANATFTEASETPFVGNVFVFADNNAGSATGFMGGRLAFYSIGESLDLALLDARVSALITAFGVAIP
jgi:hypothetical protein